MSTECRSATDRVSDIALMLTERDVVVDRSNL